MCQVTNPRAKKELGRDKRGITDARLQTIRLLMARKQWTPETHKELAKDWGVSPSRVRQLSAEASRTLDAAEDKDAIKLFLASEMLDVMRSAAESGYHRDRIEAVRTIARDLGFVIPRTELDVTTRELEGLSNEELLAKLEAETAKLRKRVKGASE